MQKLHKAFPVLAVGAFALAVVTGAAGRSATSQTTVRHVQGRIEALAMDGPRIAYDIGAESGTSNKVLVWNVQTGRTRTVSGKHTREWADSSSTGAGVFELAVAGSRVAWIVNVGGNLEGDDYLFTSSLLKPREQLLTTETRNGDWCPGREQKNCAGQWLGGLVGSGKLMAFNEWTSDAQGEITGGDLSVLGGHTWAKQIASGATTVEASAADGGRVAVLNSQSETIDVYSATGKKLLTVKPPTTGEIALSDRNLVVLDTAPRLELYDAQTGALRRTLSVHGTTPRNLDVHGNVAIYTTRGSLHAMNLSNGKDRVLGRLAGGIGAARIGSAGVVYSSNRDSGSGRLVFVPFARVAAAVG